MSYQNERDFMQQCYDAGWRCPFPYGTDGVPPRVAGNHSWDKALESAQQWYWDSDYRKQVLEKAEDRLKQHVQGFEGIEFK